MPRFIFEVDQAVLNSLQRNGGSTHLSVLDGDPEVSRLRRRGINTIGIVLSMSIKGLVAFDCDTGIVTDKEVECVLMIRP